jgi:hypothetical protein
MLTKNALNSGVFELASPTDGVNVLARNPLRVAPSNPSGTEYRWSARLFRRRSGLQTRGHHCFSFDKATTGGDFHPVARVDAFFLRQLFANFNKLLWLGDGVEPSMFGPVAEQFGNRVSRADIREVLASPSIALSLS